MEKKQVTTPPKTTTPEPQPEKPAEVKTEAPAVPEKKGSSGFKLLAAGLIAGVLLMIVIIVVLLLSRSNPGNTDNQTSPGAITPAITGYTGITGSPAPEETPLVSVTPTPGVSATPGVTPTPATSFQVTGVALTADTTAAHDCLHRFTFTGSITANMAGTVQFQWNRYDGTVPSTETLVFGGPGTQTISTTWDTSIANRIQLKVISPNAVNSSDVNFTVDCSSLNVSGRWFHNFGTADLVQTGTTVTGNYYNLFSDTFGTLSGTMSGNTLTGSYTIGGFSAPISWTFASPANTFQGTFNGSYTWCGARVGIFFPAGCGFAGDWSSRYADSVDCSMNLSVKYIDAGSMINQVTGTYCSGTISGQIYRGGPGEIYIRGQAHNSSGLDFDIDFFFADGYTQKQFNGHYAGAGDPTFYSWCGSRNMGSLPTPCLR
jgi:hypothetical protein